MFIRNTLLPHTESEREGREEKKGVKIWPKDVKHLKNVDSVQVYTFQRGPEHDAL